MTEDPKRWMDDESAPEAMRDFLASSQGKAPALPDALREAVLRRVPEQKSRVVPFVVGGVLALAAAALLALAMNTSPVQPAVPVPTLEPEPLDAGPDAGPDASTLEAIEVERVCGEEDVDYACAVHIALPRTYEEVETYQAFGVAPPTCRDAHRIQPDPEHFTQVDATHFTIAEPPSYIPQESIRVCAYEHGQLVATGSVEGQRAMPQVELHYHRGDDVMVSLGRLDDDVERVRITREPDDDDADAETRIGLDHEPLEEGCPGETVAELSRSAFAPFRDHHEASFFIHVPNAPGVPRQRFHVCMEAAGHFTSRAINYRYPESPLPYVRTRSGEVALADASEALGPDGFVQLAPLMRRAAIERLRARMDAEGAPPAREITLANGQRIALPRGARLGPRGSSEPTYATLRDGARSAVVSEESGSDESYFDDLPRVSLSASDVYLDDVLVSLYATGDEAPRPATVDAVESIRAMPAQAPDCHVRVVLEVDALPTDAVVIGYARRESERHARESLDCAHATLGPVVSVEALRALPEDAHGGRSMLFEFTDAPQDFDDIGPEGETYCSASYTVIACIGDETGLHALPGALGRWTESGPSCFTADTPIATPNGNRPIASLESGMTVLAFDPETGARSETRVTRLIPRGERPILELALSNGETMHVTAEHPLFDAEASTFREAGSFAVGDALRGLDGTLVRVISTRETGESAPVFDLSVAGPHTYFANGVVAHNY